MEERLEKMNILWISHVIPYPPKTGILQRSYNLLRETSKLGDVYLVALHKKKVLPVDYDIHEVRRELGKICRHIEIMEIPAESSRVRRSCVILTKECANCLANGLSVTVWN